MKISRNEIEIRDGGPDAPAHFASWGWGPEAYDRFQATFKLAAERRLRDEGSPIRGCPLGTGKTEDEAIADLLARTNAESGTSLQLA